MEWIKQLPNWIKGAIGFITLVITFLLLYLENVNLASTVTVWVTLIAAFCGGVYVNRSKKRSDVWQGYTWRFPDRHRNWALAVAILVLVFAIALLINPHSRNYFGSAIVGMPTPTPVPTPTPTPGIMSRKVAIQTYHKKDGKNRYVTAMDSGWDWILRGETNELRACEEFTLLCLDNGKVAFQTCHVQDGENRYVTAMDSRWDRILRGETTGLLECEQFTLYDLDPEGVLSCLEVFELLEQNEVRIALQTCQKNDAGDKYRYVTAMNDEDDRDWKLVAQADEVKEWEKFTLVPLP
jgi:hypothetical protein